MTDRKTVIFDTSGINWLLNDAHSAMLVARLKERFRVRISQTNLVELSATEETGKRTRLLSLCEELLQTGDTILPYHDIIEQMVRCNNRYKEQFIWVDVDVRDPDTATGILERGAS